MRSILSVLAVVVALAVVAVVTDRLPHALAAPTPTDTVATVTGDASGGLAVIASATGYRKVVRGLVLHSGAAGVVTFKDGSDTGTALARVYLEANKPLTIGADVLGGGFKTTRGNALFARQESGTALSLTMRVNEE